MPALVSILLGVLGAVLALTYWQARGVISRPRRRMGISPAGRALRHEPMTLRTEDGLRLAARQRTAYERALVGFFRRSLLITK